MNAYYLHRPDGTPTAASACGKCGLIAGNGMFDVSEKCCTCWECKEPLGEDELKTRSHYHRSCQRERDAKIELARIEKAELVEDYDGPLYLEGYGGGSFGEDYFRDMEELVEALDDRDGNRPEFAFCCTANRVVTLDIARILESETEDSYEDAYEDLEGMEELEAAFDAFNEKNKGLMSHYVDYKRKVRIPNREEVE